MIDTDEVKISIILPVYNGEKFLAETLKSIVSQNFDKYELIIINDGSTDGSKKIIDYFAVRCKKIVVIDQSNSGICAARNKGLAISRGKYIMFCDHDDIFCENYLVTAYNSITEGNYDFVKFSCEEILLSQTKILRTNLCVLVEQEYRNDHVPDLILQYSDYNEYIWDGIYSKDLIYMAGGFDTKFLAGCEDIDLMLKLISLAKSCKTSRLIMYKHFIRNAFSTSRKFSLNTYDSLRDMYDKRIALAESRIAFINKCGITDSGKSLVNEYRNYENKKTEQFVYALLGMFSFVSCNLSFIQIRRAFSEIRSSKSVKDGIQKIRLYPITKYSFCTYLFKVHCYTLLTLFCIIKRRASK